MNTSPLEYGKYYHIYNRGINRCNLFQDNENYVHFLNLFDKYISPVADTYAWVLMKNHFHFLVRIKPEAEIPFMDHKTPEGLPDTSGLEKNLSVSGRPESVSKRYKPANQFSHLFNAYSKAINKKYLRTGSLFEHPFKRIRVANINHLKYLVYYIHHNPIHHGFCESMFDYPWSSFLTVSSPLKTKLKRDEVLKWFANKDGFNDFHEEQKIKGASPLHIDMPHSF